MILPLTDSQRAEIEREGKCVVWVEMPEQPDPITVRCLVSFGDRLDAATRIMDIQRATTVGYVRALLATALAKQSPLGPPGTRHGVGEEWACCKLRLDPTDEYTSVQTDDWDFARVASSGQPHGMMHPSDRHIAYRADGEDAFEGCWQPAHTMPEWAARTFVTVTRTLPPEQRDGVWGFRAEVAKC